MKHHGGEEANAARTNCISSTNTIAARAGPLAESQQFHLGHRPALDGLRGVAILAVVATHAKLASGWAGEVGVDIFFVLSGFLITSLLIEEWDKFHSISLRRFYARRALRLLPALVVLIAILATWHATMSPRVVAARTGFDGLIALFYSTNWTFALDLRQPVHILAHTWTLSIEEQFYLWWPILLVLLLRWSGSRASLLRWVILGIFLLTVEKVVIFAAMPSGVFAWLNYATDARADTLLLGCAAAIFLCSRPVIEDKGFRVALKYSAWGIGIPGLLLVNILAGFSVDIDAIALHTTIAIFAVVILVEVIVSAEGVLGRLLSQRWLVAVGKISYGLYLWHYPIFSEVQTRHLPAQWEYVVEIGLTVVVTVASFYFIERPALKLKIRFRPPAMNSENAAHATSVRANAESR